MPTATATRSRAKPKLTIEIVESYSLSGDGGSPLRIDEEAGIIYGVKIGGRFSKNCHGINGVTEGTEYKKSAYTQALSLYEGVKVFAKHLRSHKSGETDRGPFDYIGVLKNARYDESADCPRGDFHYRKTHPDAPQLVEDVKRGLGGFGFSHHIPPGGYEGRVVNGRLVIERINEIKSVDLVSDPATTRNLWESRQVETTLRAILESWVAKKTPAYKAYARKLMEDDGMAAAMDAPVDAPPPEDAGSADPDEQLWAGFKAAVMAILDGDGTAADKAKKIAEYLKAHEKLTSKKEPDASEPAAEGDSGDGEPDDKKDDDKKDDKMESKELATLRAENACLKAGVKPSPAIVKALGLLESDAEREALLADYKPAPNTSRAKSGAPGGSPLKEHKVPTGTSFAASIRE